MTREDQEFLESVNAMLAVLALSLAAIQAEVARRLHRAPAPNGRARLCAVERSSDA